MAQYQQLFQDIGGAVGDLFGAKGNAAEEGMYKKAASLADMNAQITKTSTAIQEIQAQRGIYKTLGAQQAEVAGAGLQESGSAQDLLRSSAQQGALTKAIVAGQGLIQENSFEEQASSYRGMASAASSAASGGLLSGALKLGSGLASFF